MIVSCFAIDGMALEIGSVVFRAGPGAVLAIMKKSRLSHPQRKKSRVPFVRDIGWSTKPSRRESRIFGAVHCMPVSTLAAFVLAGGLLAVIGPGPAAEKTADSRLNGGACDATDALTAAGTLNAGTVGYASSLPAMPDLSAMPSHAVRRTIVNVRAFGADPLGRSDSAPAIKRAIAHAKALAGPVTIVFPKGNYGIWPEATEKRELYVSNTIGADQRGKIKNIAMLLEDMSDVVVDGTGARLIFHGKQTMFAVIRSRDVTLQGFSTEWVAPTVVDITVTASGSENGRGYRDIRIPPDTGYAISGARITLNGEKGPATGEPYWSYPPELGRGGQNQVRDLATGETRRAPGTLWNDVEAIHERAPGSIRLIYATRTDPGGAGTVVELRDAYRDTPGGLIWQSENTSLQRVSFGYLHGFGIVSQFTRNVSLDGIRFRATPGSWHQTAGFADFLQFSGVAGKVQIVNGLFDNPHDDPINVHGTYLQVASIDRVARRVVLEYRHPETAGFPQFHAGDRLRFVDRSTLLPTNREFVVRSVDGPSGSDASRDLSRMTVAVDSPLPDELEPGGFVAENMTWTPEVYIAGNTFQSIPTRAILVTTPRRVLIERNLFDRITMASIYVSGDAQDWYESGGVDGLTVRNNIFDRPAAGVPVLWFAPTNTRADPTRTVHRDVAICANRFLIAPGTQLLAAKSVSRLSFANNLVAYAQAASASANGPSMPRPAFMFDGSREVTIANNRFPRGYASAVQPASDAATSDDKADASLARLADVRWTNVSFRPVSVSQAQIASVGRNIRSVTAQFVPASPTTRFVVRFNDRTVSSRPKPMRFVLAPGPNVVVVRTWNADAMQTYRWVIVSERTRSTAAVRPTGAESDLDAAPHPTRSRRHFRSTPDE
jgi:hypothetical protein